MYLIHRRPADRAGGLGGAVVAGIRAARAPFVCVMDADLQHPPELLEDMYSEAMETGSDVVVASRFCRGGDKGTFSRMRTALSRVSTRAAMLLFPTRLWHVSDPMSGCFIVRREAVDLDCLRPRGFKILLEILVRTPGLRVSEVPFGFGERNAGRHEGLGARGAAVPGPARPPGARPALRPVRALHGRRARPGWS